MTEEKEAEEKIRDAQRELLLHAADLEVTVAECTVKLQETVNVLQSFSYSIAHDMRARLRSMGTFAQLLVSEASASAFSPKAKDFCDGIITGAGRMDNLINDALNYTKAVLGNSRFNPWSFRGLCVVCWTLIRIFTWTMRTFGLMETFRSCLATNRCSPSAFQIFLATL
jgi:light-regulated signal transduction histidine kinase (bacteriophytochrome)